MDYKSIPKVELHCHLCGIVDPAMLREMEKQEHQPPVSPKALEAALPVQSFDDFANWWAVADPPELNLEGFKPILALHIERLKSQNVIYSEVMISSGAISFFRHNQRGVVRRVQDFRNFVDGLENRDIQVEFLVAFGRNKTPEQVEEIADRILMLHEADLIVGVAMAGLEPGHPVKPFQKTFARFREAGLGIEIHVGEWCGPESVWIALAHGFPNRIGHGVAIFDDPQLVKQFQEEGIHIEMCPTSNIKTGSVDHIEAHPVKQARELNLNFSINTDDPGPFECSMESEYQLLAEVFGFEETDFEQIRDNALKACFQPELRYLSEVNDEEFDCDRRNLERGKYVHDLLPRIGRCELR